MRSFTIMVSSVLSSALALALLGLSGCASEREYRADTRSYDYVVTDWKGEPRRTSRIVYDRYGQPQYVMSDRMVWTRTGPWKRTEVQNEEVMHRLPSVHTESLVQAIDHSVPADKIDDLSAFNGSIMADRTKGELIVRGPSEEANFLAMNLAHEIITGKKTVEEARQFYADALLNNKYPEYRRGFVFQPISSTQLSQGDPGKEVAGIGLPERHMAGDRQIIEEKERRTIIEGRPAEPLPPVIERRPLSEPQVSLSEAVRTATTAVPDGPSGPRWSPQPMGGRCMTSRSST